MDKEMANAYKQTNGNLPTIQQVKPFGIKRGTRLKLGDCNNCPASNKYKVVTEINLKGLVFRPEDI